MGHDDTLSLLRKFVILNLKEKASENLRHLQKFAPDGFFAGAQQASPALAGSE